MELKTITLLNGKEIQLNQAFNMDCLQFMKMLPDKCIDLVLTDPPYGIGADKGVGGGSKRGDVKKFSGDWDSKIPEKELFEQIFRISKNQIIWGGNYFTEYLKPTSSWIIWDKREGLPERTFADCEMAWNSIKSPARIFRHKWDGMIQENMKDKDIRIHPTQKPVKLFKWCIEKYVTNEKIIFDPFLGSFSSSIACNSYGLNWLGCELSEEFYTSGYHRYEQETKQMLMEF